MHMKSDKEIAILMAAGMGERMRPLTERMPKPLIKVFGRPMIETVIEGLLERPVDEIYIVTGYLGEKFGYLKEKYPQVQIIANPDYEVKNNIASVYAARDMLPRGNCFICESDLYVADKSIFRKELEHSCYFGRMQEGFSEDWVFELEDGRIVRVGKGGTDTYNMVGIAYFRRQEAVFLKRVIEEAYALEENSQLFWDDVVNRHLGELDLIVEPVEHGQLVEIDTVEELRKIDKSAGYFTEDGGIGH